MEDKLIYMFSTTLPSAVLLFIGLSLYVSGVSKIINHKGLNKWLMGGLFIAGWIILAFLQLYKILVLGGNPSMIALVILSTSIIFSLLVWIVGLLKK